MAAKDEKPVTVFASGNYMEAQFVASVLKGSNVEAFVVDDNFCRMYPPVALLLGGAKVLVRAQDLAQARDVLAGAEGGETPTGKFLSIPLSEPAALITAFRRWLNRSKD